MQTKSVQLMEHKALLVLLCKIEDEISHLEDPFHKDLLAYKKYMHLLSETVELLNGTINIDHSMKFNNIKYQDLSMQFNVIKNIFCN